MKAKLLYLITAHPVTFATGGITGKRPRKVNLLPHLKHNFMPYPGRVYKLQNRQISQMNGTVRNVVHKRRSRECCS